MFNKYYQQELNALRELGSEFSRAHPALAPMLSGPASDPDVERLLEGVAFLTGLLRQKLDDEFPEIVHSLTNLLWPHYLKPIPSTTMVAFSPKSTLKQSTRIPAGVHLASVPVGGTSCIYRTTFDVEMHPLTLLDASFQQLVREAAGDQAPVRAFRAESSTRGNRSRSGSTWPANIPPPPTCT